MIQVRGFARNKDQTDWLRKHGLPDKAIYQVGRGAEDLDECLTTFRGRPGRLVIAHDLRAFGLTKRDVAATMTRLEKLNIRVLDISHPQDTTISEMIQRSSIASSNTGLNDRRTARRRGARGGTAKGIAALQARSDLAPDWLVRNIVAEREISWEVKLRVLDGKFSATTLRRHYRATP